MDRTLDDARAEVGLRMSPAFRRQLTLTASTKRAAFAGSPVKRGLPATYLTGLRLTPFDPAQVDVLVRLGVNAAGVLLQTFVDGSNDIVHGDVLNLTSVDKGIAPPYVIVGKDYPIQGLESFQWRGDVYSLLVVQYISENP